MPRPRDTRIDAAIRAAALAALAEPGGYAGVSLAEVARRAGTSAPALYRRWAGKPQLVLAALGEDLAAVRSPDTGCTLCDLEECLGLFAGVYARMPAGVLGPLLADCAADPELRERFMATLFHPPRDVVRQTLDRARERGDLRADADLDVALDVLGAFIHHRVLFGHAPTSGAELERAVETLLRGLANDYDALVEHSRALAGDARLHARHVHT